MKAKKLGQVKYKGTYSVTKTAKKHFDIKVQSSGEQS